MNTDKEVCEEATPITLKEELRIEASITPARKGQLYAIAADILDRQGQLENMLHIIKQDAEGYVERTGGSVTWLKELQELLK